MFPNIIMVHSYSLHDVILICHHIGMEQTFMRAKMLNLLLYVHIVVVAIIVSEVATIQFLLFLL